LARNAHAERDGGIAGRIEAEHHSPCRLDDAPDVHAPDEAREMINV